MPQTIASLRKSLTYKDSQRRFAWAKVYEAQRERYDDMITQRENLESIEDIPMDEHLKKVIGDLYMKAKDFTTCSVCLQKIESRDKFDITKCGHTFCKDCLQGVKDNTPEGEKTKCPVCRKRI